jgi:Protein of unknown function (DUF1045)
MHSHPDAPDLPAAPPTPPAPYRHAVYLAPAPDHPLWQAGSRWLGRDARLGQPVTPPARHGTASPWRYGFHATLKAPLRLAEGRTPADWVAAVRALARQCQPFRMPALRVAVLDDFLALLPATPGPTAAPLQALADACVTRLDTWRAPLSDAEHTRQRRAGLSPRQHEHVDRWGYAHVMEDWRPHFTLSDSLGHDNAPDSRRATLQQAAEQHFAAALAAPWVCDAICLYAEPAPGAPFQLTHRLPLGAT